jgi:hypothetical protein
MYVKDNKHDKQNLKSTCCLQESAILSSPPPWLKVKIFPTATSDESSSSFCSWRNHENLRIL